MHLRSIIRNIKDIIICILFGLMLLGICAPLIRLSDEIDEWGQRAYQEAYQEASQNAYYDVLSISNAAKLYHQKYGEWPETVEDLRIGKKIGQSYDAPLMPYLHEKDPWGNEYKISHTDSQILVYCTAGVKGLELSAAHPPADATDTKAIYRLTTLSDITINQAKAEQQAYYDISSISEAAKLYHQKYGEWPNTVETLEVGKKIGQSYDVPLLPSHVEKDPWGNAYKISHTDSQILVYSTAGVADLELDATNPPKSAYDTPAVFKLSTLSD